MITEIVSGREIQCEYRESAEFLWAPHKRCFIKSIDFPSKFESEKHSFSGSALEKSETTSLQIYLSSHVDFIPLDIMTEFPNLTGLFINRVSLWTVKSGLFKPEFQKLEYLFLGYNEIESIEPEALEHLTNLKWISLRDNSLTTLPHKLLKNSPNIIFIDLQNNRINSINPHFFDGLNQLKLIQSSERNICMKSDIGCPNCSITQSELKEKFQECFANCLNERICNASHSADDISETKISDDIANKKAEDTKSIAENIERLIAKIESMEVKCLKEKKEDAINQEIKNLKQELEEKFAKIIQEKLDRFEEKLRGKSDIS
jgi:Leucine-rich repeat (LRR) protein